MERGTLYKRVSCKHDSPPMFELSVRKRTAVEYQKRTPSSTPPSFPTRVTSPETNEEVRPPVARFHSRIYQRQGRQKLELCHEHEC